MTNFSFYAPTDMTHFNWHFALPQSTDQLTTKGILMISKFTDPVTGLSTEFDSVFVGGFGYGSFTHDGATAAEKLGAVSGTVTGFDLYVNQLLQCHISGLSYDALEALTYTELQAYNDPSYGTELLSLMMTGADSVKGSAFDDVLEGFDGNDTISGGARQDTLLGDAGADSLAGGLGADSIVGGTDADSLTGGMGRDTLVGGGGSDRFVYTLLAESTVTGADTISDFKHGADKIDLKLIDADTTTTGDQAFNFIGTGAFTNTAGELRFDSTTGKVLGDVNGDGVADFAINVTGIVNAADFIL